MNSIFNDQLAIFMIASLAIGVLALGLAGWLALTLRRVRRDQRVVLGEGRDRDLIAHARSLGQQVDVVAHDLRRLAEDLEGTARRMDECLTFRSVIRYDAYRDLSGMQSTSVALLDAHFSGVIISAIQSRDHARIYVKEVRHGESHEKLSPEEIHVLKEAMGLKSKPPREPVGGGILDA
jgi:hypothetical protein